MYRPSPVPLASVVKNGSNSCACSSLATPSPSSMTCNSTRFTRRQAARRTLPACLRQCRQALRSRFQRTWLRCARSNSMTTFSAASMEKLPLGMVSFWAIASRELQHVVHHALEAPRVVPNDLHHALLLRPALLFVQQVARLGNRRQGVADLVGDVGREPSERRE